jgi:hypothetical protein
LIGLATAQIIPGDVALAAHHSSRWISISGLAIGVFFLFFQFFVEDRSLFRAFLEGATASFAAMVVAGVAHRFWTGWAIDELDELVRELGGDAAREQDERQAG